MSFDTQPFTPLPPTTAPSPPQPPSPNPIPNEPACVILTLLDIFKIVLLVAWKFTRCVSASVQTLPRHSDLCHSRSC